MEDAEATVRGYLELGLDRDAPLDALESTSNGESAFAGRTPARRG
jgi:hypothetical protein